MIKYKNLFKKSDHRIVKFEGEIVMVNWGLYEFNYPEFLNKIATPENPARGVTIASLHHSHFDKPWFPVTGLESDMNTKFEKLTKKEILDLVQEFVEDSLPLKGFASKRHLVDNIRFALSGLIESVK